MKSNFDEVYRNIFLNLILGLIYFLFARIGLLFPIVKGQVTLIWPPSGIALASILIFGYKVVPGIMLGAFFTNLIPGADLKFAALTSIGNPLEAIFANFLLHNFDFNKRIDKVEHVLKLYFTGMVSCIIAPTLGVVGLVLAGVISFDSYWIVWMKWWAGDVMGIIVFAPVILTIYSYYTFWKVEKFITEITIYILLFTGISFIIFYDLLPSPIGAPLTFIFIPFIIYVALRFGQPLTSISTLLIACIAIIATTFETGPFVLSSLNKGVVLIYGFISVVALTGMILSATNTELKRTNEELQKFAHIASHNLRSPINHIISLISLYDKKATDSPLNLLYLDKIEKSALSLKKVLDELIMIVLLKQKTEEHKEIIDIEEILHLVQQSIESQIQNSGTVFIEDFKQSKVIKYPPSSIHSILLNLITNAIKYKHPDRPPMIELKTSCERNYICLTIKDNGMGIDLKKYKRDLFGLYKRFHETGTGSGLGLYMVKSQVEALGGKIKVKSEVGVGTEFKLYLYRC